MPQITTLDRFAVNPKFSAKPKQLSSDKELIQGFKKEIKIKDSALELGEGVLHKVEHGLIHEKNLSEHIQSSEIHETLNYGALEDGLLNDRFAVNGRQQMEDELTGEINEMLESTQAINKLGGAESAKRNDGESSGEASDDPCVYCEVFTDSQGNEYISSRDENGKSTSPAVVMDADGNVIYDSTGEDGPALLPMPTPASESTPASDPTDTGAQSDPVTAPPSAPTEDGSSKGCEAAIMATSGGLAKTAGEAGFVAIASRITAALVADGVAGTATCGPVCGGVGLLASALTLYYVADVAEDVCKLEDPNRDDDGEQTPSEAVEYLFKTDDILINPNPLKDEGGYYTDDAIHALVVYGSSNGGTSTGTWNEQPNAYMGPSINAYFESNGGTSTGTGFGDDFF
jgi:hypothetical protein